MRNSTFNMNHEKHSPLPMNPQDDDEGVNIMEYIDIIFDGRWIVATAVIMSLLIGIAYAVFATPIYESNILIQVEDSDKSAGSFLGDAASSLFDVKTPAAGEIEILQSRMILNQAAENTKLYIDASPRYVPIIGRWLSKKATSLSEPGIFGFGGFVSGTEKIVVARFDVPRDLEASKFTINAKADGRFELKHPGLEHSFQGVVGNLLVADAPGEGKISLMVSILEGLPGAEFNVIRYSKQLTSNDVQDSLKVTERGKQSGVINVSWQNSNSEKLTFLLNEIGRLYVRQNIERKAAEAEKTLGFLGTQLPAYKKQMENSEDAYNRFRNEKGTISLDDEAKNALLQTVDLQSKLLEAQQKRRELAERFTDKHPEIQTIDAQISALNSSIGRVNGDIKKMPLLQQDTVRMQRDIKVNTDLYISLLNSSLQMSLAKEGKVGNVRLLDEAVTPEESVKPKKAVVVAFAAIFGLLVGVSIAVARSFMFGGIRNTAEIEAHTGLNVYSTIPLSDIQLSIDKSIRAKSPGIHLLAATNPDDPAIESLRSLRTALQFAMLEAPNNRIIISGATPGVGKSFVSANFAAILAGAGRRVLLIDADLRKGYINQVFNKPRAVGLSELIAGSKKLNDCLHRNVLGNLDLLTTGVLPPNPAELLMSESFSALLDQVGGDYDIVIIDTAPVLVAADTAAVAPLAGTMLLVARADVTQLGELNETVKRISHVGSNVNGIILNAVDISRRHYGSYGYKYGGYKYTTYKYADQNDA